MEELSQEREDEISRIAQTTGKFVLELSEEGERAAVILGASRVDIALEDMIKAVLRPNPGGNDDLFEGDRPLSTFSAKITMAYRLSLIENDCERALQLIRRIRNDFAHAHERLTLDQGASANRLLELKRLCEVHPSFETIRKKLQGHIVKPQLSVFAQSVGVILIRLEITRMLSAPYEPAVGGSLKGHTQGSKTKASATRVKIPASTNARSSGHQD